jgi:hypothetical protein
MSSGETSTWSVILDTAKWASVPISAVVGWFAGRWKLRRSRKERRERLIKYLDGLQVEAKAVLVRFHENHTHSMRGNPGDRTIAFLIANGVLVQGVGGGTFDAIDCYLTVESRYWEVLSDWIARSQLRGEELPRPPGV